MAIGRVVPWRNWDEWNTVYRELFADTTVQKRSALCQVALYSRSPLASILPAELSAHLVLHAAGSLAVPRQGTVGC